MAYCTWHANTETGLTCGQCGRPICTRCVVQHPVGIRCRECARLRRLPTFQVLPRQYARAVLAALLLGGLGGLALVLLRWIEVNTLLGSVFFYFRLMALVGIGYVVGEGVSLVTNRRRGRALQIVAGAGVVISVAVVLVFGGASLLRDVFTLLVLLIAIFLAASRVGA